MIANEREAEIKQRLRKEIPVAVRNVDFSHGSVHESNEVDNFT